SFTSGDPGTTMRFQLVDSLGACEVAAPDALVSVDFLDVPPTNPFHDFVNTVSRDGITAGCGGGDFCPGAPVTRAQMAVFLLKGKLGADHVPPPATGTVFADVPQGSFAADWIEELASLDITGGCGNGDYCPGAPVTRAQMAVFLLKTHLGSGYEPPAATGIFGDVPVDAFAADWIEDLYGRGITGGCSASPLLYCPDNPNTRGQMGVFLTKTFALP
ncbi:MAG: S-layer homology domain-containing protein, partial [Candidatus Lutacidiplasmatales archaeon]